MDTAEASLAGVGYLREVEVRNPHRIGYFYGGKEQLRALKQHREGLRRGISSIVPTWEGKLRIARWLTADRAPGSKGRRRGTRRIDAAEIRTEAYLGVASA